MRSSFLLQYFSAHIFSWFFLRISIALSVFSRMLFTLLVFRAHSMYFTAVLKNVLAIPTPPSYVSLLLMLVLSLWAIGLFLLSFMYFFFLIAGHYVLGKKRNYCKQTFREIITTWSSWKWRVNVALSLCLWAIHRTSTPPSPPLWVGQRAWRALGMAIYHPSTWLGSDGSKLVWLCLNHFPRWQTLKRIECSQCWDFIQTCSTRVELSEVKHTHHGPLSPRLCPTLKFLIS